MVISLECLLALLVQLAHIQVKVALCAALAMLVLTCLSPGTPVVFLALEAHIQIAWDKAFVKIVHQDLISMLRVKFLVHLVVLVLPPTILPDRVNVLCVFLAHSPLRATAPSVLLVMLGNIQTRRATRFAPSALLVFFSQIKARIVANLVLLVNTQVSLVSQHVHFVLLAPSQTLVVRLSARAAILVDSHLPRFKQYRN